MGKKLVIRGLVSAVGVTGVLAVAALAPSAGGGGWIIVQGFISNARDASSAAGFDALFPGTAFAVAQPLRPFGPPPHKREDRRKGSEVRLLSSDRL